MSAKDWKKKAAAAIDQALDKSDKLLEIGGNMAEVIVSLRKPTLLSVGSVALRLGRELRDVREIQSRAFFRDEWTILQESTAAKSTYRILSGMGDPVRIPRTSIYDRGMLFDFDGMRIGASVNLDEERHACHTIWAPNDQVEEVKRLLGTCMWKSINSSHAVLDFAIQEGYQLEDDDLSKVLPSKLADDILANVRRYNEKGFNRSILLKGPPGTGKTSLMQYIAKSMGGKSLRLQARSLRRLEGMNMRDLIKSLNPDVILIDDFDRHVGGNRFVDGLFDGLEAINENVKLFMVSVNDAMRIPKALRRPGRFDEVVEICKLDEDIIDQYLEGIPEQDAKKMRDLPIAYLVELRKRIEVLGPEEAVACIEEMVQRDAEVERVLTSPPRAADISKGELEDAYDRLRARVDETDDGEEF
jgi:DNA polymerase III delta prime subunit